MILLVRVPDIAALRDVVLVKLSAMPQIRTTRTIFVLDEQHPDLAAGPALGRAGGGSVGK